MASVIEKKCEKITKFQRFCGIKRTAIQKAFERNRAATIEKECEKITKFQRFCGIKRTAIQQAFERNRAATIIIARASTGSYRWEQ